MQCTVLRQAFGFEEAHPALAEQHYLRTPEQNRMLEKEAIKAAKEARKR